MTWQIALAVAAALFGAFIVWRVRPSFGPPRAGAARAKAFKEARGRLASARSPEERSRILCDIGDARAAMPGRGSNALGYYLRAMRLDPASPEPIVRAARTFARKPRMLESFLWRRLGAAPWDGDTRDSAKAALVELERLYGRSLRNRSRAGAMRRALGVLGGSAPVAAGARTATLADPSRE